MAALSNTIRPYNTTVKNNDNKTIVTLYNTDVFTREGNRITLNTGGHFTNTTKNRMNEAFRQYGVDANVYQKNKQFYCSVCRTSYSFTDNTLIFSI